MSTSTKRILITVCALLVISLTLGGIGWQRLKDTENRLADTSARLAAAESRIEKLQGEGSWLVDHYPDLCKQLSMRLGEGPDASLFITPDDPAVVAIVQEITGGFAEDPKKRWADFERLYNWIIRNIEYAPDSYTPLLPEPMDEDVTWRGGFWRMPAETLNDRAGDCEDMSALLISMLLNYNNRYIPVWGIGMESREPEPARHIAVAFPVEGNRLTILDPTARYHTVFPSGWGIAAYDIQEAIDDWLARWEKKMHDSWIYMVFSEDLYQEFNSTAEFIDWTKTLDVWNSPPR